MTRARRSRIALLAVAALVGGSGSALAQGGGHSSRALTWKTLTTVPAPDLSADSGRVCDVASGDLLGTADSPTLKALKKRLDARVAKGTLTQAQADARFATTQLRVSVTTLMVNAQLAPVLGVLDMTADELADARAEGVTVRELMDEQDVTRAELRAALTQGRADAAGVLEDVCPVPETDDSATDPADDATATTPDTPTAPAPADPPATTPPAPSAAAGGGSPSTSPARRPAKDGGRRGRRGNPPAATPPATTTPAPTPPPADTPPADTTPSY